MSRKACGLLLEMLEFLNMRIYYYRNNLPWESKSNPLSPDFNKGWDLYIDHCRKLSWYHYDKLANRILRNKYYKNIVIPYSPIFVILYDCIINNMVLLSLLSVGRR